MKRIESRNNQTIKDVAALRDKREREERGLFCFEGVHLLEEYLRAGNIPYALFIREDACARYSDLISGIDCEKYEVTDAVYSKMSEEKAPQGILTVSRFLKNIRFIGDDISLEELPKMIKSNSVMPVDLRDNGNVGTVIRTSAAMGCDVLLCGSCADIYSQKTLRATMGAMFTNDIYVCRDTIGTISSLQGDGVRVIASALTDKACVLGEFEIRKRDCFLVGNEGQGLTDEVISKCDLTCIIPMSGRTESLNASVAAAMLLWEAKRGKNK